MAAVKASTQQSRFAPRGIGCAQITEAAIIELKELGLDTFSLRSLARRMSCTAMTLLHHFPSKELLLRAVADKLIETHTPQALPSDFKGKLVAVARIYQAISKNHPELFTLVAKTYSAGAAEHHISETVFAQMLLIETTPKAAAEKALLFFGLIVGFLTVSTSGFLTNGANSAQADFTGDDLKKLPITASLLENLISADRDELFEAALDAALNAVGANESKLIAEPRTK